MAAPGDLHSKLLIFLDLAHLSGKQIVKFGVGLFEPLFVLLECTYVRY